MGKFMIQFSYTKEGLQGLLKDGGSKRREAIEQLVKSLGGKLLAFYFAFGDYDGFVIVDDMENVDVAAASLIAAASGAAKTRTTVLLTPDEVDKAVKKSGNYRPPGQ